jgi:cytoskeletal protein CcmA (bactofilin family)
MKGKSGELNGFLDRGATFRGELEFEDTMRIDGKFNGKIHSKNELIVGESAHIEGDIHVGRIAISGTVIGKIVADTRVEIHRNGKVYSDVDTPALIIEEGAIFQGNCVMGDKKARQRHEHRRESVAWSPVAAAAAFVCCVRCEETYAEAAAAATALQGHNHPRILATSTIASGIVNSSSMPRTSSQRRSHAAAIRSFAFDCVKFSSQMSPTYLRPSRSGRPNVRQTSGRCSYIMQRRPGRRGSGTASTCVRSKNASFSSGEHSRRFGCALDSTISSARRMIFLRREGWSCCQSFGDHRHVARADLEKTVAAERAAGAALQVLRLGPHHRRKVLVGALENAAVVVICHRVLRNAEG